MNEKKMSSYVQVSHVSMTRTVAHMFSVGTLGRVNTKEGGF